MVQRLVAGSAMRAATLIFVGVIGGGLVLRNLEANEATTGGQNCGASGFGLYTIFSNIFENIEGPAHFHIREYSREHRCPGWLFPQEYTSFPQPLTLLDLESLPAIAATRRT